MKNKVVYNGGLIEKTKAQLIEIIFRKDAVERNLSHELKEKEGLINKANIDMMEMASRISDLKCENEIKKIMHQEKCDELETLCQQYHKKLKLYKALFYVIVALAIISLCTIYAF